MNFKNLVFILLFGAITLSNNIMQSMEAEPAQAFHADSSYQGTNEILSILKEHFQVERNEDSSSITNCSYAVYPSIVSSYATFNTTLDAIEYACFPKKNFNFSTLAYQLYHAGHNKAYQLFTNKLEVIIEENTQLKEENQKLLIDNVELLDKSVTHLDQPKASSNPISPLKKAIYTQTLEQNIELEKENKILAQEKDALLIENQGLNAINLDLNQRLQRKTQYAETIEHPQLRQAYIKNKKPYLEYAKYFGSGLLGAGLMGLGIYCYSLLKR